MNHEDSRLRTFSEWPSDAPVDACRIANGGFFYTGQGVEVQCFSCGGKISEWSAGDAIMTKHRRLDPRCPFIVDPITSGNVPKQSQNSHTNNVHQTQSIQIQPPTIENEVEHLRNSQNARLESFRNWPIGHVVTPQNLSEAGFYSIQQGDMVKCAFCNGIVGFWEIGDDPRSEHRRHFPQCSFVVRNFNEPQANSSSSTNVSITATTPTDLQELGIQTHKGPRMSDYATVESRLRTYTNWPGDLIQTPDMLSEAGFYYVGTGDQVRCFHCDGGLRHWDPQDDPWVEHAKWFPTCSFVRIIKGADFINSYKPEGETGEIRNVSMMYIS